MSLQATFLSSDGQTVYAVELLGTPPASLSCTCMGFTMGALCKHIEAVLAGGCPPKLQAIDGFDDCANLLNNSAARQAFFDMLGELRKVETAEKSLKAQKKAIKTEFYHKIARGIV